MGAILLLLSLGNAIHLELVTLNFILKKTKMENK